MGLDSTAFGDTSRSESKNSLQRITLVIWKKEVVDASRFLLWSKMPSREVVKEWVVKAYYSTYLTLTLA